VHIERAEKTRLRVWNSRLRFMLNLLALSLYVSGGRSDDLNGITIQRFESETVQKGCLKKDCL
jgi:hypothetical protein